MGAEHSMRLTSHIFNLGKDRVMKLKDRICDPYLSAIAKLWAPNFRRQPLFNVTPGTFSVMTPMN
jgi:hypothetical protein